MLQLFNIVKTIKDAKILDNINLTISDGEIVALVGESGSGKSTILQILGLLTSIDDGKVILSDQDCTNLSSNKQDEIRKKIGFIHQFHHLLPEFNVLENLVIPQIIFEIEEEIATKNAIKLLEKFDLSDLLERKPNELSGGQNQRIAILRAFINNPTIVLADEPTGNLDKKNSDEIFDFMLKNSRENKITTVIVTHNNELAKKTDRIIQMKDLINKNDSNSFTISTYNSNSARFK